MDMRRNRRAFLVASSVTGTGFLIGCRKDDSALPNPTKAGQTGPAASAERNGSDEPEVTAVEDLMREHGVIRRALSVYREAAARLRTKPSAVPADALLKTARLLRSFAEDYHEKQLEEAHIFPTLKGIGGASARDVDTLLAQHQRGREITDYVIAVTGAAISQARAEPIARTLEVFTRMYEEHAAIEDTIVFPAWKKTMSAKQLDEMGDVFEEIEHKTFGKDGFDDAVEKIEAIEHAFGLDQPSSPHHPHPEHEPRWWRDVVPDTTFGYASLRSMSDRDRSLREDLERRLLALGSKLPTSSLGRIGRTALAGLRGGRLAWRTKGREGVPLDVDALAAVVASVGQLKGVAMKAGQLLSYLDLNLPPELRSALAVLQTHSPAMPFERVSEIVKGELSAHASVLLARMVPAPAAAASIGQVHRATLPEGVEVAVKVQYPDIEQAIANDFRSAAVATSFVGLLVPRGNVEAIVGEARRAVLEECDYEREATYQQRFGRIYAGHPTLFVPAVHPTYCSRHVLTTTWVDGMRFDDFLATNPPTSERDRLGEALFEFYVGTLFQHGLYNWDPHPGNYIFRRDGRLAMLDYGSTREFDRAFVEKLAELTRAVHSDERDVLHRSLVAFGMVQEGKPYDFESARALVRSFYGPMLRDEVLLVEPGQAMPLRTILETKRELLKLRLPGEFLFVLRIRFGVMSVLARLGARANWYRLERRFAESAIQKSAFLTDGTSFVSPPRE